MHHLALCLEQLEPETVSDQLGLTIEMLELCHKKNLLAALLDVVDETGHGFRLALVRYRRDHGVESVSGGLFGGP